MKPIYIFRHIACEGPGYFAAALRRRALPAGASPLLRSMWCEQQAFAGGNTLALQCHTEMTSDMVQEWVELGGDELQPSASVQSAHAMLARLPQRVAALQQIT